MHRFNNMFLALWADVDMQSHGFRTLGRTEVTKRVATDARRAIVHDNFETGNYKGKEEQYHYDVNHARVWVEQNVSIND